MSEENKDESSTSNEAGSGAGEATNLKWYQGISKYQWWVLVLASLGWVFDIFEGQIFVASMRDSMPDLLKVFPDDPSVRQWIDKTFGTFLLGGAFGGVVFGMLSDKIGRAKTMMITILFYSVFTCVSAFAQEAWHMVVLRFLVAMGVGGEWAVASAMVAEVMPKRSRPVMSSIFHASSVFGTLLAVATIWLLIGNEAVNAKIAAKGIDPWRVGFLIGVLPALLIVWIRWKLHEPDSWKAAKAAAAKDSSKATGRISELFQGANLRNTVVGVSLATIGLVTFWGGHIYGKNALMRLAEGKVMAAEKLSAADLQGDSAADVAALQARAVSVSTQEQLDFLKEKRPDRYELLTKDPATLGGEEQTAFLAAAKARSIATLKAWAKKKNESQLKREEMKSMAINTIGGGLGLVLFGWISMRMGRKGAFIFYHFFAFITMVILFKYLIPGGASEMTLMLFLPVFGFFTLGMHAGYAVYFPELYPTRLRGTGAGFCFNMGRIGTAVAFFGFAAMTNPPTNETKALWLSPLYLLGLVVVLFGRETRDEELPE